MAIYTRTGDQGETDLFGGARIAKDAMVLEVCGTLDELNALLGLVRAESLPSEMDCLLQQIQRRLFDVGGQIMGVPAVEPIGSQELAVLEQAIDQYESQCKPSQGFILPAGNRAAASLHVARTVCRRSERRMVAFSHTHSGAVLPGVLAYVNRLSDLLFVLARAVNADAGVGESSC
jgi:cob(I)alamin adenosyltransferase